MRIVREKSRFRNSGLNGAAFRGVTPRRAESPGELAAATLEVLGAETGPALRRFKIELIRAALMGNGRTREAGRGNRPVP